MSSLWAMLLFTQVQKACAIEHNSGLLVVGGHEMQNIRHKKSGFYDGSRDAHILTYAAAPFWVLTGPFSLGTLADTIKRDSARQGFLDSQDEILDEVVVTGQYAPQSLQSSLYQVRVLSKERIESQGVQSLTGLLSNELNFRFRRDNAVGNSEVRLQGLSGQNVKVLLDGVPVVGRSGVSNEIDLNQINLNAVEKVEIVEGPMAVNYGADALAGVINVITRKPLDQRWGVHLSLQEETVGKEYSIYDQGRHNISLSASHAFARHFSLQSTTRVHHFGGWGGTGRDKLWYPKTQFFQSGLLRYEKNNFSIYYKIDYLDETLQNLGAPEEVTNRSDPYAFDKKYLSTRWIHQIQSEYALGQGAIQTVVSYTDYERRTHQFKSYLVDGVPNVNTPEGQDTVAFNTYFFRHTLNDLVQGAKGAIAWHTQFGIDGSFETGKGSKLKAGNKQMTDLGLFLSTEIKIFDRLAIRPGIRYTYNNTFSTQPTGSVNLKYDISAQSQLRISYGRGFRAPSLRELYHEFIDSNHHIVGNQNLNPEYSDNINGSFTSQFSDSPWGFSVRGFFNDINNRITYFTPEGANQATTYTNLLKYKTLGSSGYITYENEKLSVKTGFSYIGQYHRFSEVSSSLNIPQFLYAPELVAQVRYRVLKPAGLTLAMFYKYTGASKQYVALDNDAVELRQLDGYHFMDMTVTRSWEGNLSVSIGARNILDVTAVNNNIYGGGVHGGGSGRSSIGYGRSYFLRINYHFSK